MSIKLKSADIECNDMIRSEGKVLKNKGEEDLEPAGDVALVRV